jgi:hypothetical protein
MHWDETGERDPETGIVINGRGVVVYAPRRRSDMISDGDGFPWKDFDTVATRLGRWARGMRDGFTPTPGPFGKPNR